MQIVVQQFSQLDKQFMRIAINEAEKALATNNYPVGAVLVVDGKLIAQEHNHKETRYDRISHAETLLFINHSSDLKRYKNEERARIELFTTFEPCLMCLGVAVIHRVDRIVVACNDPRGDITQIDPKKIGDWYQKNWPKIEYGLLQEDSYNILFNYFKNKTDDESREITKLFDSLKNRF
jgi:tRNA(adenine34) deaminase